MNCPHGYTSGMCMICYDYDKSLDAQERKAAYQKFLKENYGKMPKGKKVVKYDEDGSWRSTGWIRE